MAKTEHPEGYRDDHSDVCSGGVCDGSGFTDSTKPCFWCTMWARDRARKARAKLNSPVRKKIRERKLREATSVARGRKAVKR